MIDFITQKTLNTKMEVNFFGEFEAGTFEDFLIEAKKNNATIKRVLKITSELTHNQKQFEYKLFNTDGQQKKTPKITAKIYNYYINI